MLTPEQKEIARGIADTVDGNNDDIHAVVEDICERFLATLPPAARRMAGCRAGEAVYLERGK